jgi:hypothetical protein
MTARLFDDLIKDATVQGVHARTALGNVAEELDRKKRQNAREQAAETLSGEDAAKAFLKCEVVKVDDGLGLVFGFAIVCKRDGSDYFDLQGDHIPEAAMLEAATDFMLHSRVSKDMHTGAPDGSVVFAFPLTTDIAKALNVTTKQTGLLIAMKPSADVLSKYRDGTYKGFSIGGSRVRDEEVSE